VIRPILLTHADCRYEEGRNTVYIVGFLFLIDYQNQNKDRGSLMTTVPIVEHTFNRIQLVSIIHISDCAYCRIDYCFY